VIVNTGLKALLTAQLSYLSNLTWQLFTSDTTITRATVLTDLGSVASWTGYADVPAGGWGTVNIVDPRAVSVDTVLPTFDNSSGSGQTFYVVALVDVINSTLVWAQNLGATVIADGGSYVFTGQITDKQE
jgi:hypothetical protein